MIPNNNENNNESAEYEENEWLEDYDYVALNNDVIEDQEADVTSSKTSAHRWERVLLLKATLLFISFWQTYSDCGAAKKN